ncbi:uncharacterized protein A1O9_08237 [Exophiala aquamarina CBS 119918]|uniref:Uncharacterized protein n=1 Tax=Exophiala aquamarina CBS 119918 TaxID=1182545 RepID=A0A072P6Y1_9EURO|nr:uncharacterized protein A1O9_08237 [Exophiala aquamarina CBS 119918]KEF55487.1 hypothetical protein A1O9_08237 [Exophiala aquamarina CBS 119918]
MDRVRAGSRWLKRKIQPYYTVPHKERKLEIGPPTDFRRENITLGIDVDGNTVVIEQAREDAQRMHASLKMQSLPPQSWTQRRRTIKTT